MISNSCDTETAYESEVLDDLTVMRPDAEDYTARDVRIVLLPGGALKVYRDRSFSDAVPFETVLPQGSWSRYDAYPAR